MTYKRTSGSRLKTHYSILTSMRTLTLFALITISAFLFSACAAEENEGSTGEKQLEIVATTGMIADVAQNIVGDKMDVVGLMGPGVDPHLYRASQNDLTLLNNADLILYNGLHLEGKMAEVLERLGARKPVAAVAENIASSSLLTPPEFEGNHDPHIWFDVQLWKNAVQEAARAIIALDSANADFYQQNTQQYLAQLDSLDAWIRAEIGSLPEESRVLITAHDAFGYFGNAYGMEVRGLQGISTVSEFGVADINALVSMIASRKVKAVFVESSVPKRNIEALVEGVKAKGHEVKIGGELFSDAMGEKGTPEGTYIGMVSWNVRTIVEALR